MRIYDITRVVQEAPIYPGSRPVWTESVKRIEAGDDYNASIIMTGSHMGTHADAFSHYLPDGATVDNMPLELYCGPCRVMSVPVTGLIKADYIRHRLEGAERIALNSGGKAFLCEQAARCIADCGVRLVITDAISVGPDDNEKNIHRILMEAGVAVIENAVLSGVPDGDYIVTAFPVKYGGLDGAPVRAVLLGPGRPGPEEDAPGDILRDMDLAALDNGEVSE